MTILLVYVGMRADQKLRELHAWVPVSEEQAASGVMPRKPKFHLFTRKQVHPPKPGMVCRFAVRPGGKIACRSQSVKGLWPDASKRAEWRAQSHANQLLYAMRKNQLNVALAEHLRLLAPLRQAVAKMEPSQRRLVLSQVYDYLDGKPVS